MKTEKQEPRGQNITKIRNGPRKSGYWKNERPLKASVGKKMQTNKGIEVSLEGEAYDPATQVVLARLTKRRKLAKQDVLLAPNMDSGSQSHLLQDLRHPTELLQSQVSPELVADEIGSSALNYREGRTLDKAKKSRVKTQARGAEVASTDEPRLRSTKGQNSKPKRISTRVGNFTADISAKATDVTQKELGPIEGNIPVTGQAICDNAAKATAPPQPTLSIGRHGDAMGRGNMDSGSYQAVLQGGCQSASRRKFTELVDREEIAVGDDTEKDALEIHRADNTSSNLEFNPMNLATVLGSCDRNVDHQPFVGASSMSQARLPDYSMYDYDSSPLSSLASTPSLPSQRLPEDALDFKFLLDDDPLDLHSSTCLSDPSTLPILPTTPTIKQKQSRKATVKNSPYFPSPPKEKISCVPFPPISAPHFGLVQEHLRHNPFNLLLACIFLNKTRGKVTIPTFYKVIQRYPTPTDLAAAKQEDLVEMIEHLGLQNQRAKNFIKIAQIWTVDPPVKGRRWRKVHYPNRDDGKDVKPEEPIDDEDPRVAWEIGHLPGIGAYALDAWRIFCRDELRGLEHESPAFAFPPSEEDTEREMQREWTKVRPEDKELRAYLRWRWARCGWRWDPFTGERSRLEAGKAGEMDKGGVVLEGGGRCTVVRDDLENTGEVLKMKSYEIGLDVAGRVNPGSVEA